MILQPVNTLPNAVDMTVNDQILVVQNGRTLLGTVTMLATIVATIPITGPLWLANGTVTDPAYSFAGDHSVGLYRASSTAVLFAASGAARAGFVPVSSGGSVWVFENGASSSTGYYWGDSNNLLVGVRAALLRDADNNLAQRNGTAAQAFRVYNTFTDLSNYERIELGWSANEAKLVSRAAGTGTSRTLGIYGGASAATALQLGVEGTVWKFNTGANFPFLPGVDNTYDFGSTALKIRNVHVGTSVNVGSFTPIGNGLIRLKTGADIQGNGLCLGNIDGAVGTARIEYACSDTARVQAYIKFNKLNASTGRQGDIEFWMAGSNSDTGDLAFKILNSGAGVLYANYLAVAPREAGQSPMIVAAGTDTNVGIRLRTQAAGQINFETAGGTLQVAVTHTATAVNTIQFTGAITAGRPQMFFTGSDASVGSVFITKGVGSHQFCTNSLGTNVQFEVAHTASAVNYVQVVGASTGNSVTVGAVGSDATVNLILNAKNATGTVILQSAGATTLQSTGVANAVNFVQVTSAATGSSPVISAQGTDTNITFRIRTKGTGGIAFETNNTQDTIQFEATHTANAVNRIAVTGAATGGTVSLRAVGSDTDVGLQLTSKGSDSIDFYTNNFGSPHLKLTHTASTVNWVEITGGATGSAVLISANGETNIGLALAPKGSGNLILSPNTGDVRFNKALVALGGGAAATLGTIGGSGPATAAQNTWMRWLDSAGAAFWVPAWK